jgi:acetylornithine deacetylase/succinyl-diaminopimelate desuccinylase-like protein
MARSATSAAEEALHKRPVELLRTLIRFDTSNPPGNERECIAYIERLLRDAGLETTTRARDPQRPNLVSRLPGRGDAPPLLLYGHVDVVTTENQQWRHPPFEAVLEDGYVWGRGALDMKGGMAMLISALLRAKAAGVVPAGDVVFCALSDEEGFGDYGAKFLVESHPELFAGIRFAIGEFGGVTLHVGGRRFYPIQVSEKQICTLRATVRGAGGHGAMPIRGGAMQGLADLLARLDRARLPVHVTPVVREMLRSIAAASPWAVGFLLKRLTSPPLAGAALRAIGDRAGRLEPLLRNTVSPTVLTASEKVNVIPSEVAVLMDGRLLPGFGPDDLIAEIGAVVGDAVELELVRYDPGPGEPDMGLFGTLSTILDDLDPGSHAVPLLMAGVTDGRFFSRLGIQTYGYLPMNLPQGFDFWQYIHASDERIPAAAVDFGSEAVYRALERYGSEADA